MIWKIIFCRNNGSLLQRFSSPSSRIFVHRLTIGWHFVCHSTWSEVPSCADQVRLRRVDEGGERSSLSCRHRESESRMLLKLIDRGDVFTFAISHLIQYKFVDCVPKEMVRMTIYTWISVIECSKHHHHFNSRTLIKITSRSHPATSNIDMSCRLFLFPNPRDEERRSCEGEAIVQDVLVSSRASQQIHIIFVCE